MDYFWSYVSVTALLLTGLFLIFIILLQRGRGGGLAGAFGGAGGQSALGTKAGDIFTRITVGLAVFWVCLACLSIYALRAEARSGLGLANDAPTDEATLEPRDADDEGAAGGVTPPPGGRVEDPPGQPAAGERSTEGEPEQPTGDAGGAAPTAGPSLGGTSPAGGDAAAESPATAGDADPAAEPNP